MDFVHNAYPDIQFPSVKLANINVRNRGDVLFILERVSRDAFKYFFVENVRICLVGDVSYSFAKLGYIYCVLCAIRYCAEYKS